MEAQHDQNVPSSLPRVAVARLVGHDGPVQAIKFTADGKYCLTGGHDRTVRLWNPFRVDPAYTPPPTKQAEGSSRTSSVVESHSYYGPTPSSSSSTVQTKPLINPLPEALPIQTYSGGLTHPISALATVTSSSSSNTTVELLLAATDKTLVITDLVTKQVLRRLQGHSGLINSVAASHQGDVYLSASYDATVGIWDGRARSSTKPIQWLRDAKDSVTCVHVVQEGNDNNASSSASTPSVADGALIRTSSVDGTVRTYDIRRGLMKCDDCGSPITSMAPTHDGQCLAISCLDGTIRLMELETGELLNTYNGHHTAGKYGLDVTILANDATIVTGSEDGRCVFYDLVRATCVQSLLSSTVADDGGTEGRSRRHPLCSIATHPKQSSVVLTASYDGNNVVWANDSSAWSNQLSSPE